MTTNGALTQSCGGSTLLSSVLTPSYGSKSPMGCKLPTSVIVEENFGILTTSILPDHPLLPLLRLIPQHLTMATLRITMAAQCFTSQGFNL